MTEVLSRPLGERHSKGQGCAYSYDQVLGATGPRLRTFAAPHPGAGLASRENRMSLMVDVGQEAGDGGLVELVLSPGVGSGGTWLNLWIFLFFSSVLCACW